MKENRLNTFLTWSLVVAVFLLPTFFAPYFINPLINSKLLLVLVLALLVSATFIISSLQKKSWELIKTPFTLPLLGFALLVVVSSLISHQYPSKQLLGIGGAYLSFALVVLLTPSLLQDKFKKWLVYAFNSAALLLSVLSILQLFGLGLAPLINRLSVLDLPNSLAFSLSGATFVGIQFLSVVLIANVFDQKAWKTSVFNKVTTVMIAIALGINIWSILPGGEARFQSLSLSGSATIAKDSLTFTKNALFGYGPDSYGNAYNILKPIWINGFNYWKFTFDSAFNFPLTIIVSLGLIAFLIYLLFLWQVFKTVKESSEENIFLKTLIFALLVWQFLAPVNLVMLAILGIALAFFIRDNQEHYQKLNFSVHHLSDFFNRGKAQARNYVFLVSNGLLLAGLVLILYFTGKTFVAYHLLYKSNASVTKNEIAKAYDYHKQAKNLAPQLDFVRRSYSLINLQIAIALSNKADITPAEQEQVLQLVNQAIREAKAATVLDPANYQNWSVLAQIYVQLAGTTEQAKQEAFNALARAATYNPNDPEIRLALGQLFFNSEKYSEAITFFDQAIERKPDLFVAHYYMARAFLANKQLTEARSSLINSLNLAPKDSEEYKAIEKELNALVTEIESLNKAKEDGSPVKDLPAAITDPANEASSSGLSNLLDEKDTEAVIQEGALSSDQSLVEN